EGPVHPSGGRRSFLIAALGLLLVLGGVNLWATLTLPRSIPPANTAPAPGPPVDVPATNRAKATENSGERFARALHHLLRTHEGTPEWGPAEITRQYDRLAAGDKDLRLLGPEGDDVPEAKEVVVALSVLSRRSAGQIEALIRKTLKGYDPRLIDLVCQQVRE